jgi:hypothetical protein
VETEISIRERRFSPEEVRAVLGRAIELQVGAAATSRADLISESDLVEIAEELGLPESRVRQALAETAAAGGYRDGWLGRHVGPARASASRVLERDAGAAQGELERYLRDTECMVVYRRLPGRTVYRRASGLLASLARGARRFRGEHPLLEADEIDVSVEQIAPRASCVVVGADLSRKRLEVSAAGGVGAGAGAGVGVAAGVVVAPPTALVALPVIAGALLASRSAYRRTLGDMQSRLESLLDRLEHGELTGSLGLRARLLGF